MPFCVDEPRDISDKMLFEQGNVAELISEEEPSQSILPRHVNADPENVERGLVKLVLTLIELLRQLLERRGCPIHS